MARTKEELPRWAKVLITVVFIGIIIWAIVPRQTLYLSIGIAVVIIGGVSYLIYRKQGITPFKEFAKKSYGWFTQDKQRGETVIAKVSPLSEAERGIFINAIGNRCENPTCRQTQFLDVHHIIPRAEGGSNRLKNLIVLCPTCHRAADRHAYSKGRLQSWIRRPRRFRFRFDWQYK